MRALLFFFEISAGNHNDPLATAQEEQTGKEIYRYGGGGRDDTQMRCKGAQPFSNSTVQSTNPSNSTSHSTLHKLLQTKLH